jgi:hypothetical protein
MEMAGGNDYKLNLCLTSPSVVALGLDLAEPALRVAHYLPLPLEV